MLLFMNKLHATKTKKRMKKINSSPFGQRFFSRENVENFYPTE